MPDWVYQLPDAGIFLLMIVITVSFSLFFIIINKFFKFYLLSYKNNTAIASVASLIGIIYGVLAGFTCLYLLSSQDNAAQAALSEGVAAANIYRESKWLNGPVKDSLQTLLKKYMHNVVTEEWPAMTQGKDVGVQNGLIILKMSDLLHTYPIHNQADLIPVNALLQDFAALYKGRRERIEMGGAQLSIEIWIVIILSTFLIIIINYAFRMNFKLHLFSLTVFAVMASSVLFLLTTLDRPFQGEFIVEPDALLSVMKLMDEDAK